MLEFELEHVATTGFMSLYRRVFFSRFFGGGFVRPISHPGWASDADNTPIVRIPLFFVAWGRSPRVDGRSLMSTREQFPYVQCFRKINSKAPAKRHSSGAWFLDSFDSWKKKAKKYFRRETKSVLDISIKQNLK